MLISDNISQEFFILAIEWWDYYWHMYTHVNYDIGLHKQLVELVERVCIDKYILYTYTYTQRRTSAAEKTKCYIFWPFAAAAE